MQNGHRSETTRSQRACAFFRSASSGETAKPFLMSCFAGSLQEWWKFWAPMPESCSSISRNLGVSLPCSRFETMLQGKLKAVPRLTNSSRYGSKDYVQRHFKTMCLLNHPNGDPKCPDWKARITQYPATTYPPSTPSNSRHFFTGLQGNTSDDQISVSYC